MARQCMLIYLLIARRLHFNPMRFEVSTKEAVWALIGGGGILPIMLTVLILIIMESDVLYHANQAKLPKWVVERFPNPDAKVIVRGEASLFIMRSCSSGNASQGFRGSSRGFAHIRAHLLQPLSTLRSLQMPQLFKCG